MLNTSNPKGVAEIQSGGRGLHLPRLVKRDPLATLYASYSRYCKAIGVNPLVFEDWRDVSESKGFLFNS